GLIRSTYLSLGSPLVKAIEGEHDTLLVRPALEGPATTPQAADEVRRRAFANPLYVGSVIAADSSATAIVANFRLSAGLPGYAAIQDRLASLIAKENDGTFDVYFGGPVAVLAAVARVTERTVLLFPLAVLVVGLIHYEAFRTIQGTLLPLLTALIAVIWS